MRLTAYRSLLTDPYRNLALENSIYETLGPAEQALFLYRNEPSIIIGRHQNPWRECDLQAMRRDAVPLVRRQSGGGTVYHDLGNLNYTFLTPRESYDQEGQFGVVIAALRRFGIAAERSGRNDLLAAGRKISGSAFKHKRERSFHHGTVLIESDLSRLNRYLEAPERRLEAKGIASVRSAVVNAAELSREIGFDALCEAIEREWARYLAGTAAGGPTEGDAAAGGPIGGETVEERLLGESSLASDARARDYEAEIRSWGWLYGKTPDFTETHSLGPTVTLSVRHGCIAEVELNDAGEASSDLGESIRSFLPNRRYDAEELESCAQEAAAGGAPEGARVISALAQRV